MVERLAPERATPVHRKFLRLAFSGVFSRFSFRFLSYHHDVARGKVAWEPYVAERERVAETPWYQFLNSRFSMYYTKSG